MHAEAGAKSRRYTGCIVCMRRQEPRAGDIQDVLYACGGRSQEQAMFRMNGIPTVINRKLCMQAKAGAVSLPARGEGVGISGSRQSSTRSLRTQNQEILGRSFFEGGSL
jgi:hypothetical protein